MITKKYLWINILVKIKYKQNNSFVIYNIYFSVVNKHIEFSMNSDMIFLIVV